MATFLTLNPIDPGTDTRVTVRLCSTQNPDHTGAASQVWWPAILSQPVIQTRLFDGDFTSGVNAGSANVEIALNVLRASGQFPRVERYDWAGATATIQRLVSGSLVDLAVMKVDSFAFEDMRLGLRLSSMSELFDADVLTATYAGTTGLEGGADLKGQVKPWVFGRALNVEPVFIDQIDNVFQVSGYGPVQAISAVYERGASFGASVGNYASFAALLAAPIPEGRWGTCLAQGLIRLGAPPAGVITCDVDGDNNAGFLRRTGAILTDIASRLSLSSNINTTSLSALDTAVARNVNILIREQTSFLELVQRMVAPCNAVPGIGADGRLLVSRVTISTGTSRLLLESGSAVLLENGDDLLLETGSAATEQARLDAQGRELPPVLGMARQNASAPYKRIQMGAARSWRVHTLDEISFIADLIDLGLYDAATVYREGNIVSSADRSRWVYTNPTPSAGNAPPTWPTVSNVYWENLEPPADIAALPGTLPWSRTVGSGRPETFTFGSRGTSATNRPSNYADGLFNEAGTIIGTGFQRSYTVHHRNIGSSSWTSTVFDVFGDTAQATAMATHLNGIASGAIVVVLGFDDPRNNRLLGGLPTAMYRCGASRSVFGRNNWFFRPAYALVGRAGLGEGLGTEFFQDGGADSSADSWISGTFSIVNGIPVVGFSPIRGAEDISYPNGVRLDELQPSETGADVTATAQRTIEPQFPVIEIKQGEAGHTGNRTVTHVAKRGTATLSGGTWSLPSENLGTGDATINSSTGTVTLSSIVQSGAYVVRYTHTDAVATDFPVNVTYVPTPPGGVVSAKTGKTSSSLGTINNGLWQTIATLTITSAPAGRVNFEGDSFLDPLTGSGTADFEARLRLDGTTDITTLGSQAVVDAGSIVATDFSGLFAGVRADVAAGTRTFTIELRRTSGTGVIGTTNTALEATIIAT